MKKLRYIFILMILAGGLTAQHSTLTSNYLFNVFAVNPAYAGQKKALDINLFYRKQWVGFNGAPQNISILSSMEIRPKNLSLGVQFDNDQIGLTKTNSLRVALAYRVKFSRRHTISFALMPGYKRINYDYSKLRLTTEGDATYTANSPAVNIFNSGAGVYYYSKKLFFGLSTPEMIRTRSNGKFYEFNAIGGGIIKINENVTLKPSFLIRQMKHSPVQLDLNLTAYINDILGVGTSYRYKEAMLLYFDFSVSKKFKFGYAYDYSVGPLKRYNKGAHEIMLNYFFGKFTDAPTPRYF